MHIFHRIMALNQGQRGSAEKLDVRPDLFSSKYESKPEMKVDTILGFRGVDFDLKLLKRTEWVPFCHTGIALSVVPIG